MSLLQDIIYIIRVLIMPIDILFHSIVDSKFILLKFENIDIRI
jgi:hypothetical protein